MSTDAGSGPALPVLTALADTLARGADLDAVAGELLAILTDAVGADVAAAFVVDDDGSVSLVAAIGVGDFAAYESHVRGSADHPVAAAARTGVAAIGRPGSPPDGSAATAADLPLIVGDGGIDRVLGVVSFAWSGEIEVSETDAAVLRIGADLLAVAIDRARLASLVGERAEWLERLAQTDPLTGLANARTLGRVLELEILRAVRHEGQVAVAVFDIDGLGAINDRDGRGAGDDALRIVAEVVGGSVRLVDTVGRTGADEFVVVAPGAGGATVAQRVIDGVAARADGRSFTVSAGIARFPDDGASADELLEAARTAVLSARDAGGGRLATVGD